jgi:predicted DsbA family dithiol-disulfide isomerase
MRDYDIEFFWDPVCPFAWITSRWITKVVAQIGYTVDWRLISLRLLNSVLPTSPRETRISMAYSHP